MLAGGAPCRLWGLTRAPLPSMGGARITKALEPRAAPGEGQGLRSRKESHLPFYLPLKEIPQVLGAFLPQKKRTKGRGLFFGGALLPPAGRRGYYH